MNRVLSDKKAVLIFIFPAMILFLMIVVIPIFLSGYYSLLDWDGLGEKIFVGIRNYKDLFVGNSDGFPRSVLNSLLFAFVSVFVQLPVSLFFALILAKGVKGENFYRSVYFIPVIMSTVVIGQLWMKVYHPEYGLLNSFLRAVGLGSLARGWLGETETALWASFAPILWQYIGYHMLLMYASIKSISPDILEAARIDGSNFVQTTARITIPLITPMLKACVMFSTIGSLKIFDLVYVLTNGGPAHASEVPSTLLVNSIFMRNMYGYGSAIAIFIILECFIFTFLIQKCFKVNDDL